MLPFFIDFTNPSAYLQGLNCAWFGNFIAPNILVGSSVSVTNSAFSPKLFTASTSFFILGISFSSFVNTYASCFSNSHSMFSSFIMFSIFLIAFSFASKYCFAFSFPCDCIK